MGWNSGIALVHSYSGIIAFKYILQSCYIVMSDMRMLPQKT